MPNTPPGHSNFHRSVLLCVEALRLPRDNVQSRQSRQSTQARPCRLFLNGSRLAGLNAREFRIGYARIFRRGRLWQDNK